MTIFSPRLVAHVALAARLVQMAEQPVPRLGDAWPRRSTRRRPAPSSRPRGPAACGSPSYQWPSPGPFQSVTFGSWTQTTRPGWMPLARPTGRSGVDFCVSGRGGGLGDGRRFAQQKATSAHCPTHCRGTLNEPAAVALPGHDRASFGQRRDGASRNIPRDHPSYSRSAAATQAIVGLPRHLTCPLHGPSPD